MKMWYTNVMILLLFCNGCLSTGDRNVFFVSTNFYNVLHWEPVEAAFPGQKVLYTVEYRSDQNQTFQIKKECQNIPNLFCNLTEETPSLYDVYYTAKVLVNGSYVGHTNRFRPLAETTLGPPILSTHTTASTLYVNIALPTGPNGVPISDIIAQSKNGISRTIPLYTLQITSPEWAALTIESESEQFVINLKSNQIQYCGFVVYRPSTDWGRSASEKASFCVMQDNSRMLWQVLFVSATVLGVVVIMSVVCACRYVKGGKSKDIPQALKIHSGTHKVPLFPDKNLIISKIAQGSQTDQITYAKIQAMANVSSTGSGGYSPQDIPCHAWQDSSGSCVGSGAHTTTPQVEDTSAQSSEIYVAVANHIPAEEQEDFQQATTEHRETSQPGAASGESWDTGWVRPQLTFSEAPTLPDVDPCESSSARPLLLNTVRDNKGQLVLPLLSVQFHSGSGETASPLTPDRKPLLSDILDSFDEPSLAPLQRFDSSDSGCDDCDTPTHQYCNSHYHPSQPYFHQGCSGTQSNNGAFESGYKQNWMPAILCGHSSTDSCEYRRTNSPWNWTASQMEEENEEGEEDEGRGGDGKSNQIVLGKWIVQIPE
ncbi:interferon lambda receptor 1 [Parambassis ranga]|uniref:Tissue factor n=1 Tax=Parambassis ranga TaxID=210632 RepID=A0A6P7JYC5_9TELE|nr:uncharacterized protein LOC114448928 [Parambassis ranga]